MAPSTVRRWWCRRNQHPAAALPSDRSALWLILLLGLVTLLYVYDFDRREMHLSYPKNGGTATITTTVARGSSRSAGQERQQQQHPHLKFTVNLTELSQPENLTLTPWRIPNGAAPPLCNRSQIIDGSWVPEHLPRPPYVPTVVHLRCYTREKYYDKNGWDTYKWVPRDAANDQCDFTKWRYEMYCAVLRYATVLIVGDSLSWEHYASLVQLLGVPTHQGYQFQSLEFGKAIGQSVCDGKSRVMYRRDDRLTHLRDTLFPPQAGGVGTSDPIPQVVVLNRGAHYANDTLFLENLRGNLDVVEEWQDRCDDLGIKCHFFWRTTVPGHPNCWNDKAPVSDKAAIEARIGNLSMYDEVKMTYHWYDYQHQNLLAEEELRKRKMRHRILDAYHLNVLRPDEHRAHQGDCLHSCYPGKMDVYSRLLLHYLRGDRTKSDADTLRSLVRERGWVLNSTTLYDRKATEAAKKARLAAGIRTP